jgi:uncharacterized protein YndB with AHSA1/START domain
VIRSSIEINRPPAEVFAYIDDLDRHAEWQAGIVSAHRDPMGPTRVGTRSFQTRRVPGGTREFETEIVEHNPPRRLRARALHGRILPTITVIVEPLGNGTRSRVTTELVFEGRGFGKVLAIFVRRAARRQVPLDQAKLKEILERRR